jgi:dCTP deaminase
LILPDYLLRQWASAGGIEPFDPDCINPASIDLRLGNKIRVPHWYWRPVLWRLAYKLNLPKWTEPRIFDTYLLKPGEFVLCSSMETTRIPDDRIGVLFSKSSIGRRGIEHLHAGYCDPGFGDNERGGSDLTWELTNCAPWPNLLEAGKPLMQLVLAQLVGVPLKAYRETGHYNDQSGPTLDLT